MDKEFPRIRHLNHIEEAFTLTNQAFPLRAVIALNVTPSPTYNDLAFAVTEVQKKHLLLQSAIKRIKSDLVFSKLNPDHSISVSEHHGDLDWKRIVEHLLNLRFPETGPLVQIDLIKERDKNTGTILVSLHHAIIDGNSARVILDEILTALSMKKTDHDGQVPSKSEYIPIRPKKLIRSLIRFLPGQVREEWKYRRDGMVSLPAAHSDNKILQLRFTENQTQALQIICTRHRLNLNNLLIAAMTISILKNKYPEKKSGLVRIVNFANVRLNMKPKVNPDDLGCYISMLRLTVPFTVEETVISLAGKIKKQLIALGRKDTIKLMAWLSKYLVRLTLWAKNTRMGVSALSYIGRLDLASQYGHYQLHDVSTFISNNKYGPEFSGFGKILHDRLGVDLNYLTAETSDDQAQRIANDMQHILLELVEI